MTDNTDDRPELPGNARSLGPTELANSPDPAPPDGASPAVTAPQGQRVNYGFVALFILALFASYIAIITPSVISLALRIQQINPGGKVASLSMVLSIGALCAVIANPLFGKLSDRTTARIGMRRPWMIAGLVGGIIGLAIVASSTTVTMVTIGWCITQAMFNALLAPLVALLPDQVPQRQRGLVGGFMGICYPGGLIIGGWIASSLANVAPFWMIMTPATPAVVFVLLLCARLKDKQLDPAERPSWNLREFLRTFWFNPRRSPDFGWTLLGVFLTGIALITFSTYQVYYLSDYLDINEDTVPRLTAEITALLYGCAIVSTLVSGWLADRYQRRKFLLITAGFTMAAGLAVVILLGSLIGVFIGASILGLGAGFYFGGHYALPAATLPSEKDAAKDMGIANIAVTIPSSLVPLYAPLLLGMGSGTNNYTALFASGIVLGLLAIPAVRQVRSVA